MTVSAAAATLTALRRVLVQIAASAGFVLVTAAGFLLGAVGTGVGGVIGGLLVPQAASVTALVMLAAAAKLAMVAAMLLWPIALGRIDTAVTQSDAGAQPGALAPVPQLRVAGVQAVAWFGMAGFGTLAVLATFDLIRGGSGLALTLTWISWPMLALMVLAERLGRSVGRLWNARLDRLASRYPQLVRLPAAPLDEKQRLSPLRRTLAIAAALGFLLWPVRGLVFADASHTTRGDYEGIAPEAVAVVLAVAYLTAVVGALLWWVIDQVRLATRSAAQGRGDRRALQSQPGTLGRLEALAADAARLRPGQRISSVCTMLGTVLAAIGTAPLLTIPGEFPREALAADIAAMHPLAALVPLGLAAWIAALLLECVGERSRLRSLRDWQREAAGGGQPPFVPLERIRLVSTAERSV